MGVVVYGSGSENSKPSISKRAKNNPNCCCLFKNKKKKQKKRACLSDKNLDSEDQTHCAARRRIPVDPMTTGAPRRAILLKIFSEVSLTGIIIFYPSQYVTLPCESESKPRIDDPNFGTQLNLMKFSSCLQLYPKIRWASASVRVFRYSKWNVFTYNSQLVVLLVGP